MGLGENAEPALCSMPWSTGKIEIYPVLASLPLPISVCMLRNTGLLLFEFTHISSTCVGEGNVMVDLSIVLQACPSKNSALSAKISTVFFEAMMYLNVGDPN